MGETSNSDLDQTIEPKAPLAKCGECPLQDKPFVPSYGPDDPDLIVIGEAPGAEEIVQGKPFVGQSGKLLRAMVAQEGGNPDAIFYTNTVLCRPPGNRAPTNKEARCCAARLARELGDRGRAVVLPAGASAAEAVLGDQMPGKITATRGAWFKTPGDRWVLPTWHPAYILRQPSRSIELQRDIRKAIRGPSDDQLELTIPPKAIVLATHEMVAKVLGRKKGLLWAADFETSQNDFVNDTAILLVLTDVPAGHAYIIPGNHPDVPPEMDLLHNSPETIEVLNQFWAANKFVGHNFKYDRHFGHRLGIQMGREEYDTMLAHYLLDERTVQDGGDHGLKALMREYLNVRDYDHDMVHRYLRNRSDDWRKVPWDSLVQYAAWDAVGTMAVWYFLRDMLVEEGLWNTYMEHMMPFSELAFQMEETGFQVDVPYLEWMAEELTASMIEYEARLQKMSGKPELNPRSPQQIAEIIYDERDLEPPNVYKLNLQRGVQKISERSTSKLALEHYAIKDERDETIGYRDEFLDLLFRYRRVHKIKSAYVDNLLARADERGRIHFTILLHGTETGRISIRNPALQTIPRSTTDDYGAMIRAAFMAAPGYVLVDCDYSQAEMRVWASLTGDPFLLQVYADGRDLHSEVAVAMFGENWTKEHRMIVKKFNFAYVYGGGFTALMDSEIPQEAAKEFMDQYNSNLTMVAPWREQQWKSTLTNGYVESPFGRRRRYPLVVNANRTDAMHASYNMPVQSGASDLSMISALRLMEQNYRVLLTIHDSVVVEVPKEEAEWHMEQISTTMKQVGMDYFPNVRWGTDPEIMERWHALPESYLSVVERTTMDSIATSR